MHIINTSATNLKNNVSEILNDVYFNKKTAVVKRYGTIIAKIIPADDKSKDISTVIDKYFGALPDFPDLAKKRKFRKRKVNL
jgi:antitoxin (DNA-binding transcriptional repressor) of toxin-antitoxin stability system